MILLDTNIIAEIIRLRITSPVVRFVEAQRLGEPFAIAERASGK